MKLAATALVVGCAAYGVWYAAIGGKQISEENVRDLYHQYWSAFDRGDAKAACGFFADDVTGRFESTSRSMPVAETINKTSACAAVDEFYQTKQRLEAATGQELYTNLEYTIKSITISADGKLATVEVLTGMRIGTEQAALLDMRSNQVDKIRRNFGKARFVQTDGTVSFYR